MNVTLQQKLFKTYPDLFYMHFDGFGICDGWYMLLIELFDAIHNHPLEKDIYPVQILEIQQLYGELHIHHVGGDDVTGLLFSHARSISIQTCEVCGEPGHLTSQSWNRTLCKEHVNAIRID